MINVLKRGQWVVNVWIKDRSKCGQCVKGRSMSGHCVDKERSKGGQCVNKVVREQYFGKAHETLLQQAVHRILALLGSIQLCR